jgi:hypothetical protein
MTIHSIGSAVTGALTNSKECISMTDEQRAVFDDDCAAYDADVDAAKVELVKLATLLPAPGTEQDPKTRAAIYWDILKLELSPENISRVCRSAMAGRVSSTPFLPVPGDLIAYANTYFQRRDPVRQDPRRFPSKPAQLRLSAPEHKLLTDKDNITPDTIRKQIAHQFRLLAKRMGTPDVETGTTPTPQATGVRVDANGRPRVYRDNGFQAGADHTKPLTISDSLRAALNRMPCMTEEDEQ